MKRTLQGAGLVFFAVVAVLVLIAGSREGKNTKIVSNPEKGESEIIQEVTTLPNPLRDATLDEDKTIYASDSDGHLDKIFITVFPPKHPDSIRLEELNSQKYRGANAIDDTADPVVEILFETDQPNPSAVLQPNGTMELRGQTARAAAQKSYKIDLFDNTPAWKGSSTIDLNKHFYATLKVENKLAFDFFEKLPDFTSFQTRFVRLFIKDLSAAVPDGNFRDYGLFTFIEQPNKSFLERHGLDKNGHLYKAQFFEFYRYPDAIKTKDDTTFDQKSFDKVLEVKGSDNHAGLIKMLDAVNDYSLDINDVVDRYFDRENLFTWLAVNIIFDNFDTNSRNFFLYNPLNSEKWFFVPWDYDGVVILGLARGKWQKGLANYWGMPLFNRFFKDSANVEALGQKIEEVSEIMSTKNIKQQLDKYYPIVKGNLFKPPDLDFLKITAAEYDRLYQAFPKLLEDNIAYYYRTLEDPMPFFLSDPARKDGRYQFIWGTSFDLQGDDLTYDFTLSTDPYFKNVVNAQKGLSTVVYNVGPLKPGHYYWKVVARDSKGNWQNAFDYLDDGQGNLIFGVREFQVLDNLEVAGEVE